MIIYVHPILQFYATQINIKDLTGNKPETLQRLSNHHYRHVI